MPALKEISTRRMNTVTLSVPQGSQMTLLRSLSRNMGWKMKVTCPKKEEDVRYPALDRAIEDVKKGNVVTFNNVDDMMQYLMSED